MTSIKTEIEENFHGTIVKDPFRWLENSDLEETKEWDTEQMAATVQYMEEIPERSKIYNRLKDLWNYPKYFVPKKHGDFYYYLKNIGSNNQPTLYRAKDLKAVEETEEVILNVNSLADDGTIAITNLSFHSDGKLLAYALSEKGSDWQEFKILNLETIEHYPEKILWCKFSSIAWSEDGKGFFYNRYPEAQNELNDENHFNKVYWHTLNTEQTADEVVFEYPEDEQMVFYPTITSDNSYLILYAGRGTEHLSRYLYKDLTVPNSEFKWLLQNGDALYSFIGIEDKQFYFFTDKEAPNGKIISFSIDALESENWTVVIPETEESISTIKMIGGHLVVSYIRHASYVLKLFTLSGEFVKEIPLPELGTIVEIGGKKEGNELYFSYTSYLSPTSIYKYSFETDQVETIFSPSLQLDLSDYKTEQVFYESKDGTKVPMFLTYKKGMKRDGQNPVLLYGYGGYHISLTPSFSASNLLWLENGGIYAVANIRGGGEYGLAWHEAGMKEKKQNVFDDFIAAGEYLISEGYTTSAKLAIMGGSNGGLLVAACMIQRPELFGAIICNVPVLDMLRFQKFTVGRFWVTEFGDPEGTKEEFEVLYAYSPLHNIQEGLQYPPILITTADSDDRVVPAHARKFAAALQDANPQSSNPILLRIEKGAGHGLGKPVGKIIGEHADIYAFLFKHLYV
ncbi:prolyl oligopeptidase family serine peptidase [Bacillus sp. DTU_2020_1000418_1_SI_GHA_SEK_038]|uniref:prolyl oligopeptidase family serine peptidase n=1 Tax=Bacillus sp. DTU_2020_1000418_1_SI_GHA_SEK_038 TaxID=3077585 RepID=UPI0028E44695|nr:prolyl oligopeptidase family serine peptidase [Bacillus sp. DTU_2020_1000418_1_SI_GHA_SEK_038]WNS74737.1 prolyl oligopeptidase family serine peptidase [Bacillus sp. DTU_2020_1000418_1_SI_GHA_SEK_038]